MDELPNFKDVLVLRYSKDNELSGFVAKTDVIAIYMHKSDENSYHIHLKDGKILEFAFYPASEMEDELMRLVSDMGWN